MKYYRYLYVGDGISKVDKIKTKLNLHQGTIGIFIIALADGDNQLEIINASYLKLPFYRKKPFVVVGLAKGYDEAVDLVIRMTNESIQKTGTPNVKEFLKKRAKTKDFTIEE